MAYNPHPKDDREDRELISEAQQGSRAAFEEILAKYQKQVIDLAYRFLGNKEEAEDIAQEVFLRVYRSLASYRMRGKFFTWLYRITLNLSLNQLRKKKGKFFFSLDAPLATEKGEISAPDNLPSPLSSPREALEEKERQALIKKALFSLPVKQKEALILRTYEELSYLEIARILDCSPKAVERCLARARENLKSKLRPFF